MLARLLASDVRLALRARDWDSPRWLELWLRAATRLGDGWAWIAAGLPLLLGDAQTRRVLLAGILAGAVANTLQVLLKHRFQRPRPCDQIGPSRYDVLAPDRFSFPSGHTLNAVLAAVLLGLEFPILAPGLAVLALSIAASRVILGLHYLSDVVAGALLGGLIGGLAHVLLV